MLNLAEDPDAAHIHKMAIYLNADVDEDNDVSTITMDTDKAKGFISSYRIFSGLTVLVYNIEFQSDSKIDLGLSDERSYYFSYNVRGHFLHRFDDQEEFVKILQNQNLIIRGNVGTSGQVVFPANVALKIAVIKVDQKLLGNLQIRNAKRIFTKIEALFQEYPTDHYFRHLGSIDTETEKYASIVCENKNIDLVRGLLAEAAVYGMLASQLYSYKTNLAINQTTLSVSELSKLTSLSSYVLNNLEVSLTILKLSRHFGMSPKKLQSGINHLYGKSVGHYVLSLRMDHARYLLSTTDLNVTEVCARIGISSRAYFSKVFKNRFGKSPSDYIN
jgi:AraC-like DNA-binding protein